MVRYVSQAAIVIGPMFTAGPVSLLDIFGLGKGSQNEYTLSLAGLTTLVGPKSAVQLQLALVLSILGMSLVFVYDYLELYLPQRKIEQFRADYLESLKARWREALGPEVRLNVMMARRHWWLFGLVRVFSWTWSMGFDEEGSCDDGDLFLTEAQGVCGQALRSRQVCWADLRVAETPAKFPRGNQFKLWPRQVWKTRNVKAVISVPILLVTTTRSGHQRVRAVGVINVDSLTASGAEYILSSDVREDIVREFGRVGKLLAKLR
jgi:hypothetical protein